MVGLDDESSGRRRPAGIHVERTGWGFRPLSEFLGDYRIDSIVHAGMTDSRSGAARTLRRADVIETMHLAAAASALHVPGESNRVRRFKG